jgi:hypothetical protein
MSIFYMAINSCVYRFMLGSKPTKRRVAAAIGEALG